MQVSMRDVDSGDLELGYLYAADSDSDYLD